MKKIISLAVVLCCLVALVACSGSPTSPFESALAVKGFTKATITQVTETALGDLTGTFTVTYNEDGTATIDYEYEQWNDFTSSSTELKSTVTGSVTRQADGTYSDGKGFNGSADEITAGFAINLESIRESATVSADGNTLTVTVPADSTEAVLGVNLGFDAELKVVIAGGVLSEVVVSYTVIDANEDEYTNTITCKYE